MLKSSINLKGMFLDWQVKVTELYIERCQIWAGSGQLDNKCDKSGTF